MKASIGRETAMKEETIDYLPCLDLSLITPSLRATFEARGQAGGRGAMAVATTERWELRAEEALRGDWDAADSSTLQRLIRRFVLLSQVLPGEPFDHVDPDCAFASHPAPEADALQLMARALWLLYDCRGVEARKLVVDAEKHRREQEESEGEDEGSVIVVEGPRSALSCEQDSRSSSPLSELEMPSPGKGAKKRKRIREEDAVRVPKKATKAPRKRKSSRGPTKVNREKIKIELTKSDSVNEVDLESSVISKGKGKAKGSASGWTCRPAPPSIMDMLQYQGASTAAAGQASSNISLAVRETIPPTTPFQRSQDRRTPRTKNKQELQPVSCPPLVPLSAAPPTPVSHGISSSKFCAVLRLITGVAQSPLEPTKKRPKPKTGPPVWAESRQELCEALPYYRAFQSGLYMFGRICFGYLLEAFPAPRDVWAQDGRTVISHGGGQCIRTVDEYGHPGPPALQADQSRSDARVDALLTAAERGTPIVLIAGQGYELLPWTMDCAYVVLGWYWISYTWTEGEAIAKGLEAPEGRQYFHRIKIRFDWVDSQGIPWWQQDESAPTTAATMPTRSADAEETCAAEGPSASSSKLDPTGKHEVEDIAPTLSCVRRMGRPNTPNSPSSPSHSFLGQDHSHVPGLEGRCDPSASAIGKGPNDFVPVPSGLLSPPITPPKRPASVLESPRASPSAEVEMRDENKSDLCRRLPDNGQLSSEAAVVVSENVEAAKTRCSSRFTDSIPCPGCHRATPQIYTEGFICLDSSCSAFWMLYTDVGHLPIPPGYSLTLSSEFLRCVPTPEGSRRIPYNILPPAPVGDLPDEAGVGSRTLWKGWVCERCRRANCRHKWEVWECRNCGNTLSPLDPHKIVPPSVFSTDGPTFLGDAKIHPSSGIISRAHWLPSMGAVAISYQLPLAGTVWHIICPTRETADDLLERYQREAAEEGSFQRRPLKGTAVKGPLLAQHYAVNAGRAYKFNVDTISYPFESSPTAVVLAHDVLVQTASELLGKAIIPFNELLSVMYREGQKMSWHDDGERGLGPVVASLSLGSSAIMSFRKKQARTDLNSGYYHGQPAAAAAGKGRGAPAVALSITLSHGDIMIMDGAEIQKKYDHRVVPSGLRVAATARVIGEQHV